MNIKIKKLACFSGVILSYFIIFFFGQTNFLAYSKTATTLSVSIADKSIFSETEMHMKSTNQLHEAKLNDIVKILGYRNPLFKYP